MIRWFVVSDQPAGPGRGKGGSGQAPSPLLDSDAARPFEGTEKECQMSVFDVLTELNLEIGVAESMGDKQFLGNVLAPVLAFRRAIGECVGRDAFLGAVKSGARRETEIESISLLGHDRAVVTCIVSMGDANQEKRFHNVRLFVLMDREWKLLGWANEPA
jgi:hypothetical protein